ncbi:MAG TPA: type II toxin-antitoxin system Phd/YefM family antitoxin, partial [Thermoanaerobaculia bacterium]
MLDCSSTVAIIMAMMSTVTASQAKNSLLELLRDVEERGEAVQITRNGIPAGVLISAEEWETLLETLAILSDPSAMKRIA